MRQMIKNIAIAIMLTGWLALPSANAGTTQPATGTGSGTTSTYTTSTSTYGTFYTYSGYGSGGGSGGGSCWPYCTVPEPSTYLLMGVGFLGLYLARRRK